MKNRSVKTLIVLFIILMVGLSASSALAQNPVNSKLPKQKKNKKEQKQETCLRVAGSALDEDGFPISEFRITLFKDNEELVRQKITHQLTKKNQIFFDLTRNAHYSIVVSKEGYVSRLINISTALPDDVKIRNNVFVFEYEVTLYTTNNTDDSNYLDFPIALISYNPINAVFENHEHYTRHIKKKINSDSEEMTAAK